ncbi:MAG: NADH-quinone oxidoreductase subunit J/K, partial [Tenuifilaceae bacterium]|nr:NADH-quinone oxidoreductase subunit J/K [Tenuifilaceae bacterium]
MSYTQLKRVDLIFDTEATTKDILQTAWSKTNEQIVNELLESGLKGRGGAGFPTAMKWKFTSEQPEKERFVICNADEGEPGTFKDREILFKVPQKVFGGMAVCAKVIGATQGFVYLRGEYRFLLKELQKQLDDFHGILKDLGINFSISIVMGSGAYICGEESALFESMEGKRGEPRNKPPYPTIAGFRSKPTVINNVETLVYAFMITKHGAKKFKDLGTADSRG